MISRIMLSLKKAADKASSKSGWSLTEDLKRSGPLQFAPLRVDKNGKGNDIPLGTFREGPQMAI